MRRMLCFLLASLMWASGAAAVTFRIEPGKPNLVRFESKAPLETFDGKTHQVQGQVTLDPAALDDSLDVRVEVDLASLDTGIAMRNKHMRENHLETDKFPKAVFSGGKISQPSHPALTAGEKTTFFLDGTLALHGVEKPMRIPIEMTLENSGTLRVLAHFPVALADHAIARPSFLVMKLQDVQLVTVELVATAAAPGH